MGSSPTLATMKIHIFKQKAGVISENDCWVAMYAGHMHIEDTLLKLLWSLLTEWKHDRHLVG